MTCLVTLLDLKLQIFKRLPTWPFLAFFMNFSTLIWKHRNLWSKSIFLTFFFKVDHESLLLIFVSIWRNFCSSMRVEAFVWTHKIMQVNTPKSNQIESFSLFCCCQDLATQSLSVLSHSKNIWVFFFCSNLLKNCQTQKSQLLLS